MLWIPDESKSSHCSCQYDCLINNDNFHVQCMSCPKYFICILSSSNLKIATVQLSVFVYCVFYSKIATVTVCMKKQPPPSLSIRLSVMCVSSFKKAATFTVYTTDSATQILPSRLFPLLPRTPD